LLHFSLILNGVKVSENKTMRLSTLLGAVFTASTILSVATPSKGETSNPTVNSDNSLVSPVEQTDHQKTVDSARGELSKDSLILSQDPSQTEEFAPISLPVFHPSSLDSLESSNHLFVNSANDLLVRADLSAVGASLGDISESSPQKGIEPVAENETISATQLLAQEASPQSTPASEPAENESTTPAPETPAPETPAPETPAPETPQAEPFSPGGTQQPGQPQPTPTNPRQINPTSPTPVSPANQPDVLVAEVAVSGVSGELEDEIYRVISLRPGRTTTRSQLQEDINAIFATGYFSKVRAEPEDTPLGVRVTFVVEANPVLTRVEVTGNSVLPQSEISAAFENQYGKIINFRDLQQGIQRLNNWYQQNGYILAQVIDAPEVSPDGLVTLEVAEGTIENVEIRFLNKDGEAVDENGEPITGRTKEYIITRELGLEPGGVFNRSQVERDLQRVFGLGIFEDVQLSLNPGTDPRKVVVVVNVIEKNTGSIAAGAGVSSASGLFGTVSYQEQNMFGRNQKLGAEVQIGERALLYDISFTDPWIAGTQNLSYTVNAFRRRSISLIFDGGENEVTLENGDRPRLLRLGGGVSFFRPLARNWRGSLGLQYQRVSVRDGDGDVTPRDELGNLLSFNEDGQDDLITFDLGAVYDGRNSAQQPTQGSVLRLSTEQSIPVGSGSIFLNRLRGSFSHYVPVNLIRFSEGPQTFAVNFQAGTVIGDLPPYEAFSLGGSSTVRGYGEGELGTGRSYVQATAEYRFPVYSLVGGALFFDVGSDLGTGGEVDGDPAGVRGKPGEGFGYGLGIRVQSPLGAIRVDYGFNDEGDSRFHFGIGEKF
jgi:outer membrane protein insertion porin family